MKVNEIIIEAGLWQGIKSAGSKIAGAAGSAAMGTLRNLDKLAGGTGNIGTAAQRNAYASRERNASVTAARAQLPKDALAKFNTAMQEKGFDISKPATFNTNELKQEMQKFAFQYFAGREDQTIQQYILRGIQAEPLPPVVNTSTILKYFTDINIVRDKAYQIQQQTQSDAVSAALAPAPAPIPAPPDPEDTTGVTVRPGRRIVVTDPKGSGTYYKTNKGWFNGLNQQVVRPESISYLENLADGGMAREEPIPAPGAPKSRRRRKK